MSSCLLVAGPPPDLAVDPGWNASEDPATPFLSYARILATMLDGVLVAGRDGRVLIANDAASRIFGVPREELLAPIDSYFERFEVRTLEGKRAISVGSRALDGEIVAPVERLLRTPDGRDKTIRISAAPLRDDRGVVIAAVIVLGDITAAKTAEVRAREQSEALRESEERYRAFFENLFELVGVYEAVRDDEGNVVDLLVRDVNEPALALLGLPREEVIGKRLADLLGADLGRSTLPTWSPVLATGEPIRHELAFKGRTLLVSVARMSHDTLAAVAADITERKQVEDAMREADRRKNEFLGILSHELRNPLAPIRNSIHVLDRAPGDSAQASRAKDVLRRQTEHLARLVDDLLDVTRISRGKIQLQRAPLDLRDVVRRTCEDHRSLFEQGDVELHIDLPVAPVRVEVDAARIAQVVGNLLQNASKFTPPHGVVTVTVRARDGLARVSVRDTGIGMEPAQLERLFEPFAQEERGLARTRGGLGLGLALAKGLVALHGGTLDARSEGAGRGSEFVLTLPLLAPAARAAPSPAPPSAPGATTRRQVLIIEDNVDAAESLADLLELEGHGVRVARDAATGIALARELRPDVVLCDIGLPDADGYAVARALRADESLRSTRLIALTGYAQPEDKERAKEAGFDAHLSKPAPLDALNALLA